MSGPTLLFLLRLLSALALLAFLGALAWFLYREMRVTAQALEATDKAHGFLELTFADSRAERHPLRSVTTIGRASTNSIVLSDGFASSQHALITRRGQQWWLEDLDSSNGTLLNDIELEAPTVISSGDTISIGDVSIKLLL